MTRFRKSLVAALLVVAGHDSVLHDFENNAREELWKALKARFPSVRLPTIVYLDSKED